MGNWEKETEILFSLKRGKKSGERKSENPRKENGKGKLKKGIWEKSRLKKEKEKDIEIWMALNLNGTSGAVWIGLEQVNREPESRINSGLSSF